MKYESHGNKHKLDWWPPTSMFILDKTNLGFNTDL